MMIDWVSIPELQDQLSMVFTKTVFWLKIIGCLTPTIRELDAGEEGMAKNIKKADNND